MSRWSDLTLARIVVAAIVTAVVALSFAFTAPPAHAADVTAARSHTRVIALAPSPYRPTVITEVPAGAYVEVINDRDNRVIGSGWAVKGNKASMVLDVSTTAQLGWFTTSICRRNPGDPDVRCFAADLMTPSKVTARKVKGGTRVSAAYYRPEIGGYAPLVGAPVRVDLGNGRYVSARTGADGKVTARSSRPGKVARVLAKDWLLSSATPVR